MINISRVKFRGGAENANLSYAVSRDAGPVLRNSTHLASSAEISGWRRSSAASACTPTGTSQGRKINTLHAPKGRTRKIRKKQSFRIPHMPLYTTDFTPRGRHSALSTVSYFTLWCVVSGEQRLEAHPPQKTHHRSETGTALRWVHPTSTARGLLPAKTGIRRASCRLRQAQKTADRSNLLLGTTRYYHSFVRRSRPQHGVDNGHHLDKNKILISPRP